MRLPSMSFGGLFAALFIECAATLRFLCAERQGFVACGGGGTGCQAG